MVDWRERSLASFPLPMGEAALSTIGGQPSQGREVAKDPRSFLSRALSFKQAPGCGMGFVGECVLSEYIHDHWEDIPSERNPGMSKRRRKQVGTEAIMSLSCRGLKWGRVTGRKGCGQSH